MEDLYTEKKPKGKGVIILITILIMSIGIGMTFITTGDNKNQITISSDPIYQTPQEQPLSQAGDIIPPTQSSLSKFSLGSIKTKGWNLISVEKNTVPYISNSYSQTPIICETYPDAKSIGEIPSKTATASTGTAKPVTLTQQVIDSKYGNCYQVQKGETYIKIGTNSTVYEWSDDNKVEYTYDGGSANFTYVRTDGTPIGNITVSFNPESYKILAYDNGSAEGVLNRYRVDINSTSRLIEVQGERIVDNTTQTDYRYYNFIPNDYDEIRHYYNFGDVCRNNYSNCSAIMGEDLKSAILYFNSYREIDPTISNITSCMTFVNGDVIYNLNKSVKSTADCFVVANHSIHLNCTGDPSKFYNWINGTLNESQIGFYSNGYDNITISNCIFLWWGSDDEDEETGHYIKIVNSTNVLMENVQTAGYIFLSYGKQNYFDNITNLTINKGTHYGVKHNFGKDAYGKCIWANNINGFIINNSATSFWGFTTGYELNNIKNLVIENTTFDGTYSALGIPLEVSNVVNFTFYKNDIINCITDYVKINDANYTTIKEIYLTNSSGLSLDDTYYTRIDGWFSNFTKAAAGTLNLQTDNYYGSYNNITILNSSYDGIQTSTTTQYNNFSNITIRNLPDGKYGIDDFGSANNWQDVWIDRIYGADSIAFVTLGVYNSFTRLFINNTGAGRGFVFNVDGLGNVIYDSNISSGGIDIVQASSSLLNFLVNVTFSDSSSGAGLWRGWYYRAKVNDTAGNDLYRARVRVYDNNNNLYLNQYTNTTGYTSRAILWEYFNTTTGITYYNNYSTNASYRTLKQSHSYNLTLSRNIMDDIFTFALVPQFTNVQVNKSNPIATEPLNFSAEVTDDVKIDSAWLQHNFDQVFLELENQSGSSGGYTVGDTTSKRIIVGMQTFSFDNSGYLTNISLNIRAWGGLSRTWNSTISVEVRPIYVCGATTCPSNQTILGSVNFSTNRSAYTWYNIVFPEPIALTGGVQYALVLNPINRSNMTFYGRSTGGYPNGRWATGYKNMSYANNLSVYYGWATSTTPDLQFGFEMKSGGFLNETPIYVNAISGNVSTIKSIASSGYYQWRWCGNDSVNGLGCSDMKSIYVSNTPDTTKPKPYWVVYPQGVLNGDEVELYGYATDDILVQNISVWIKNDSTDWLLFYTNDTSDTQVDLTYFLNSSYYATGANLTIKLEAADSSGNVNDTNFTIYVSHIAPMLSVFEEKNPWITPDYPWYKNGENITFRMNVTAVNSNINWSRIDLTNVNGSGYMDLKLQAGNISNYALYNMTTTVDTTSGAYKVVYFNVSDSASPTKNVVIFSMVLKIDNDVPLSSGIATSPSPAYEDNNVTHQVLMEDGLSGIDTCILSTNASGSFVNYSSIFLGGTNEYCSISVNYTDAGVYGYQFFLNDTKNNKNNTDMNYVTITSAPVGANITNVTFLSPANDSVIYTSFNITYSVSNVTDAELDTCWVLVDMIENKTNSSVLVDTITNISITLPDQTIYNLGMCCNNSDNVVTCTGEDVGQNITVNSSFFDYDAPNCTVLSRTPTNIEDNSTGVLAVVLNCTDISGINVTQISTNHYPFFITRTVDNFQITTGMPNYWSVRYPNNSLGVIGTLTPPYTIWRALGRNRGFWYENLTGINDCTGLTPCYQVLNDTFSYAIEDGNYGHFTITNDSISAIINYTHPAVDVAAFRQVVYLSYEAMVKEIKKNKTIENNNYVIQKGFDPEAYRSTANYTANLFANIGVVGSPTKTLRIFYCNSSYNPAGAIKVINSPNCVLANTLTAANINVKTFTDRNSTYSKGTFSITNGYFAGIKTTAEYYLEFESPQTSASAYYQVRYANGTSLTGIIGFNETKVAWSTTNGGTTWIQQNYTIDYFTTFTRSANDEFQLGAYVCDNKGNCMSNFSMIKDEITITNHPISFPLVLEYNSTGTIEDLDLEGNHTRTMQIRVACGKDPDSVGNVTHNLTLSNEDGTYNRTINSSFLCPNDIDQWIEFDTKLVLDGRFRTNITAISGDNPLDIKSRTTDRNFTIDNSPPYFVNVGNISILTNESVYYDINATDARLPPVYYAQNWTTKFKIFDINTGLLINNSALSTGLYYVNITINDTVNNVNSTVILINVSTSIAPDTTPPTFTNLRNFSQEANQSFSQSITATDDSGIDSYWLNDTTDFVINRTTGLITNNTELNLVKLYWLNISVNDTKNNVASGIFKINITSVTPPSNATTTVTNLVWCRYKKYGYYNTKLAWFREENCL